MKADLGEVVSELREQGWRVEQTSAGQKWIATPPDKSKPHVTFSKVHHTPITLENALHHLRRSGLVWPPPKREKKPQEQEMIMGALHEDTMAGLIAYLRKQEGWTLDPTPDGQWWRATPPGWLKAIRFPTRPTTLQHVIAQLREAGLVWPPPDRPRPQAVVRSVPFPPRPNPDVVIEDADAPLPPPPPPAVALTVVRPPMGLDDAYKSLRESYEYEQLALQDRDAAHEMLASAQSVATKAQATYEAACKAREVAKATFDTMLTTPGAT
jgi:hypothetical protein